MLPKAFVLLGTAILLATMGSIDAAQEAERQVLLLPSTSDPAMDRQAASIVQELSEAFGVRPSFSFYEEGSNEAANAVAISPDPSGRSPDGCILLGVRLLSNELASTPGGPTGLAFSPRPSPNFTVRGILAHEFGHLVQFKNAARSGKPAVELEADYLAGWYIGRSKRRGRSDIAEEQILATLYKAGGSDHGTRRQRAVAFMGGLEDLSASAPDAYSNAQGAVASLLTGEDDRSNPGAGSQPTAPSRPPLPSNVIMGPFGQKMVVLPNGAMLPYFEPPPPPPPLTPAEQREKDQITVKRMRRRIPEIRQKLAENRLLGRLTLKLELEQSLAALEAAEVRLGIDSPSP